MKSTLFLMVGALVLCGVAEAQTTGGGGAGPAQDTGYVEGVAQSAFGNVTSQSYGVEVGYTITTGLQVFVEAGRIRDVATADLGVNAPIIVAAVKQSLTDAGNPASVGYTVKEPVSFGVAGLRYLIPISSNWQPYVLGGFGVARYTRDVRFLVGGTDVTGNLAQYGVVLGSDLSGAYTKPMLSLGLGVAWPAWERLVVDFQYRYGRIFAENQGINVSRAGIGVGVRF
jgi:opacity protein-like surface antigen